MTRITIISPDDTIVLRDDYRWKHHIWAIKKNGISGLFGTPAVRETPTDRPQTDGAYWPSRLTQKPRSISLDCVIRGLSSVDAAQARDRINALAGKELTIVEHTASGPTHADRVPGGRPGADDALAGAGVRVRARDLLP